MFNGHTPGPWKVELIGSPRVLATDAKGDFPVCDVRGWGHLTGKGHGALGLPVETASGIQDANARLIAAAPELLAALEKLMASCEAHPAFTKTSNTITFGRMQSARAAIAKATGGAS